MAGVVIVHSGGELVLDATPSQKHQRDLETTDHAIEGGGVVSDHVRERPRTFQIEGVSLDTFAYSQLHFLMDRRELVSVRTSLEVYENVLLISLLVPRDASTGDVLRFSATFREMRFAESQRVTVRLPKAKVSRGNQPTSAPSADTKAKAEAKVTSILGSAVNALVRAAQ
jgi:hypothetical protein